jgi:WD40 repeat protein
MIDPSDRPTARDERVLDLVLRADELYHQGQSVTPEDLCGDCPELLEPFQQALQAAHWMDGLLERPTPDAPAVSAPALGPSEIPTPLPDVPGYEMLEVLGRGGMGVVYKARQVSANRVVALKMIRAGEWASPAEVQRFRREAEEAANLDHPYIVPLYEVGHQPGRHYFSMKLVEGGSLAQQRARFIGDPRAAARLLAKVARAVHFAHQRTLLHRDLKPGNILLDALGEPYVTDFGLAKRLVNAGSQPGEPNPTQTGAVLGTPSYMAPEQARGEKGLSTAVDVYALGAILYELLAGRPPFPTAPVETSFEVLQQVQSTEPVPVRRLQPRAPRDLETICLKCLQKEPSQRYASAEALADDLERFLAHEPIQARPVGALGRLGRWCRRHPVEAALVGAVAIALLAGAAVATHYAIQADEGRQAAEKSAQRADRERLLSERRRYVAEVNLKYREQQDGRLDLVLPWLREQESQWAGPQDVRGFEYYYLDRLCHLDLFTLPGGRHATDSPLAGSGDRRVAFSPAGGRYLARAEQREITIWDVATRKLVRTLRGHKHYVTNLAFSPDGQYLASASAQVRQPGQIKIWEAASGKELRTISRGHQAGITCLAFGPGGKLLLASGGTDLTVRFWDARSGHELRPPLKQAQPVMSLAFSPDGAYLAVAGGKRGQPELPGEVRIWEVTTGRSVHTRKVPRSVLSIVYSPDGGRLAWAAGKEVVVAEAATGRIEYTRGHRGIIYSVAFSPDRRHLATASDDRTVKVWTAATGQEVLTLRGHIDPVVSLAYSPDGRCLASAGRDQTVKVWAATVSQECRTLRGLPDPRYVQLAYSPNGGWLAWVNQVELRIRAAQAGRETRIPQGRAERFYGVAFSPPDGRYLAWTSAGDVKVRESATGTVQTLRGQKGESFLSVAFSPDGRYLAAAGHRMTMTLWETATAKELWSFGRHTGPVAGVAFSRDGQSLASASFDKTVRIWDTRTGKDVQTLTGHTGPVVAVAYSPDGKYLTSAGIDKTVRVWQLPAGKEIHTLRGHSEWVTGLAYSPDGRCLASAARDGTIKVWEPVTGQAVLTLRQDTGPFYSVAFSPDGKHLAAAGKDGRITIWDAAPLSPELRVHREALNVVQFWSAQALPQAKRLARMEADRTIDAEVRQKARALAEQDREVR